MKRRTWKGRHRNALRGRKALLPFAKRAERKPKAWTFERLEDRYYFSATPLDTSTATAANAQDYLLSLATQLQTASLSSDTAEGAAAIALREQLWASMQAGSTSLGDTLSAGALNTTRSVILPNDPLFADQWHLLNTGQETGLPEFQSLFGVAGQDIHVVPVWNMPRDDGGVGYTGAGVTVAVIDSGVQTHHPDLHDNISPTLSFNAITGTNVAEPTIVDPFTGAALAINGHGTSVAGLIGAVANNNQGGTGVAPDVTLVPIKLIDNGQTFQSVLNAFQYAMTHGVDITNNSWGPADIRQIQYLPTQIYDVLRDSVIYGRGGLGMINVFAAGNGGGPGFMGGTYDSASYDPFVNSRFVIGVTGVDEDGMYANPGGSFTSYPEVGANVLVAAPTGSNVAQDLANDTGQGSGLWTTDLVGDFGFNAAPLPNGYDQDRDPLDDPDYTSRFNGTSGAAPIVSGVIALMLEANPNLTFRDVEEILVRSARTTAWYESPGAHQSNQGGAGSGLSDGSSVSSTTTVLSTPTVLAPGAPGGGLAVVEDWGDAPSPYPTTAAQNGARHQFDDTNVVGAIKLGNNIDAETSGQPTVLADGDDVNPVATDDEDGVAFPVVGGFPTLTRGQTAQIHVFAPNGGVLNGWIDFDVTSNPGWQQTTTDHVITNRPLLAGDNLITIAVPSSAALGLTYARFRITSQTYIDTLIAANLQMLPTGLAPDGEVEDYALQIQTGGGVIFGGGFTSSSDFYTTWQTNQIGPFREVDPFWHDDPTAPEGYPTTTGSRDSWFDPLANPAITFNFPDSEPELFFSDGALGNDFGRQNGHYELMPGLFANGSGYTVSQGYGEYGEQVGYAHGVIDAELAVQLARQWTTLNQSIAPGTEKTYTTFFIGEGNTTIPAAVKMPDNGMMIPGGIFGQAGYGAYYDQYVADPPAPFDPASASSWPRDTRGLSYVDFTVPENQQINVESVEVKVTITGATPNLNYLRLMLTSPEGTQSELNYNFSDPAIGLHSLQVLSAPIRNFNPLSDISPDGTFSWTFNVNRSWGESTNGAVIIDPITGNPVVGPGNQPIIRNWELHIENWGTTPMGFSDVQVVWHGKPVAAPSQLLKFDPNFPASPGTYETVQQGQNAWDQRWLEQGYEIPMAQRIQGNIGIDQNGDNLFNFDRYVQNINPSRSSFDTYSDSAPRADDIIRTPDYTDLNHNGFFDQGTDIGKQEDFASNVVVSLYRVNKTTGLVEAAPSAYFLTGADGNFYFDVDPTYTWVVRITDPLQRDKLDDVATPSGYEKDYQSEWTVTPDWFFASDHIIDSAVNTESFDFLDPSDPQQFKPGFVAWGSNDANGDGVSTIGPMPFTAMGLPIPQAVKNINFLLKNIPSANTFNVTGSVYADLNASGTFDFNDAKLPSATVYWDANRNGVHDASEVSTTTDVTGTYTLAIPGTAAGTFAVGVELPGASWSFKNPSSGVQDVFLPTTPTAVANFGILAPAVASPSNPAPGALSTIFGTVFSDVNANGIKDNGEGGAADVRVFIDANQDGVWQATETSAITASNGAYAFVNVTPANNLWIDVAIDQEGTANAPLVLTTPVPLGHREVSVGAGGAVSGVQFGVQSRTDSDWGDLPDSYNTLSTSGGPSHTVIAGFQLGATNSGEVNGLPNATATGDSSDDGVSVAGGLLQAGTSTLHVELHGVGGLLTGWMDFNNNGQFDAGEKLSWSLGGQSLGTEADLNDGTYDLQVAVPGGIADGSKLAARFRWGTKGLSFTGHSDIGEVEDYYFTYVALPGDFNKDGTVDQSDFNIWKKQNGTNVTAYTGADGNGDGVVNQADYDIWRNHFGQSTSGPGAGSEAVVSAPAPGANTSSPNGSRIYSTDYGATLTNTGSGSILPRGSAGSAPSAAAPGQSSVVETSLGDAAVAADGVSSETSVASAAPYLSFVADAASSSMGATAVQASTASGSSNSDLLLLDQTWAALGSSPFGHDDDLFSYDESHEILSTNDLALAAVLKDDDEQWNTI